MNYHQAISDFVYYSVGDYSHTELYCSASWLFFSFAFVTTDYP
jgi:hypothetical protein